MCGAIKKTKNFFSNSCAKNLAITNKNIISGETGKIVSGGAAADCKAARVGKKKSAKNVPGKRYKKTGEKTRKKRSEKYIKKQRQNVWRNGAENRRKKTFFHTACRKCILKHNHIDFKRKIPTEKVKKE